MMTEATRSKPETITIRLSTETQAALAEAQKLGPYSLSKTTIVERGIALAVEELKRLFPTA